MERAWWALLLVLALLPMRAFLPGRRGRAGPAPGDPSRYRRLAAGAWRRFGVAGVALPLLAGRPEALWRMPPAFAPVRTLAGLDDALGDDPGAVMLAAAGGMALSFLLMAAVAGWRGWRGRRLGTFFGDAGAILARGGDAGGALWLAFTAGVTEELYFRLALPLLAALATGSAAAGFAGSAVLFALAHRYQGWRGVIATGAAAIALTALYLATASLVAAMAVHALTDAFHLFARPAAYRWEGRRRR